MEDQLLRLIEENGLRGRLTLQSFVTGQLMVELGFYPDKEAVSMGDLPGIPEVPTIQSDFEQLTQTLDNLPVKEILDNLNKAVSGVEQIINSQRTEETVAAISQASTDLQKLIAEVRKEVGPLSQKAHASLDGIQTTIKSTQTNINTLSTKANIVLDDSHKLLTNTDQVVTKAGSDVSRVSTSLESTLAAVKKTVELENKKAAELAASIQKTSEAAREMMITATQAINRMDALAKPQSPMQTELRQSLREITETAKSIQMLTDYLQRHPEALLQGKK